MKRWKLVSGLLLVFVLGILAGSFGTRIYLKDRFEHLRKDPKARQAFIMRKLSKELELTQDQKTKIEKIVEQVGAKRREFFLKNRPEIKRIMDEGFLQIKKELNNDQQKKLDALRKEFEKRRKARDASRFHQ
jgi:Spy/CpxP family protein refolding chaperone